MKKILKKNIRIVIGTICLVAAIIAGLYLFNLVNEYKEGNDEYSDLIEEVEEDPDNNDDDDLHLDWDALKAINPDIVGWIVMDPTVNYPVVQGRDNDEYLHLGFYREYNINGSIFMSYLNTSDWLDVNTVLYGHNMLSGAMFGNNSYYRDIEYAKAHPYIYIYVPEGKYTYQIYDCLVVPDASEPYTIGLEDEEEFQTYLNDVKAMSLYTLDVPVTTNDRILTLSTCDATGRNRVVIQGVMKNFKDSNGVIHPADSITRSEDPIDEDEFSED